MKLQKSLLPSLITLLSVALAPWPTGVQAETAASKAQPTSAVAEAASSQFIAPAAQPPEPEWQESDDAKNPVQEASEVCTSCDEKPKDEEIVWETWLALPPEIKAKVDPRILAELQGAVIPAHLGGGPDQADIAPSRAKPLDKTRFLVHLTTKANLQPITWQTFATREARRTAVLNALVHTAQATQGPVRALLDARISQGKVTFYQSFYIFNGFAVEGDLDTLIKLAQRDDVERIVGNYPLLPLWKSEKAAASPVNDLGGLDPENWGIDLVDAERVWSELGITGQGAVVANIDTGVDYNHPALAGQYRGNLGGGTFNHNYNWFDPDPNLYPSGDLGPSRSAAPFDFGDHGTHTMGTMVGDGGAPGTQVGMAPGANWIALSLNEMSVTGSVADDIMGHKAFQWMLCPTDLSGNLVTADCSKAPDVVNNSWGSANPADDTFRPAIQALRAAGIAPVFAAGNPSAGLGSIGSPGSVPEAITVGATDINDNVASFSGRGPSFYAGEQKPELSAPGVNVKSTVPGGGYASYSGTSMAAPHVAGLIALMVSADLQDGIRDLNVDELERFMASTAVDLGSAGADNDYGYGRIDASNAVRWARSAGDLQGTVRDAGTGIPIAGATVTGVRTYPGDTFTNWTDASGYYSTTVPAGTYNITVEAWGYYSGNFSGQMVITGSLSIADFVLPPLPTATLSGRALSGATPVSGARVYVAARPSVSFTTGADGVYSLLLPVGSHELVVEATGHRILHQAVSVAAGGSSRDFNLTPAPTILLVDADAYAGWFLGWPVRNFFQVSLDQEDYLYDLWVVQYTTFNDTQVMPDGSPGYGIPSATTLGAYDLVIWAHGGGNWWPTGSTVDMGAADELMDYLDSGGRLIISGQDLGWADDGTTFYDDYLHADYTMDAAAGEGDTISGQGFLAGLSLELTNASLRGYANGATDLWPDAVAPEDGAAYPVLAYDNGNGVAALAIDPCDASYRAVYLALGYENIGPRADNRDPAIAEVLDRSIDWVMGTKPTYRVNTTASPSRQTGAPGTTVTYDVQVLNTGALMDTFAVSLSGNVWPTRIYSGGGELTTPIVIPPCSVQDLTVEVDIPTAANIGDMDTVSVAATGHSSDSAAVTTVAFPFWQIETPMPTPRYRLAAASLPGDIYYYAIGGMGGPYWGDPMYHNERYNACAGQWEAMAPMPTARGNIGAAEIAGKIYVPGGYADGYYLDVLEVYDPATDTWSTGAPLPEALSGASVAAYGGRLYTFGGTSSSGRTDKTYAYNPATAIWTEKTPMPGGPRSSLAAAVLNGKIYVTGGWPNLRTVEVYNPATDSWSLAAPMNVGRQSPGLTAAPDGYLYVSGGGDGWTGLNSAERYNPVTDTWEIIPSLNDISRAGSASAYAAGRVFAIGGVDPNLSDVNESLRLADVFCLSDKSVLQHEVQPGDRVTYTIELHADPVALTGASVVDPIPAGTTFAGFGVNPIGATYNSAGDQVEWHGSIPSGSEPLTFTFGVDVAASGWTSRDHITNTAIFDSGDGLIFSRSAVSVMDIPDPSPSIKTVDKHQSLAGDGLIYALRVENASTISDVFTLRDPIPLNTTYVPGSLTYSVGTAGYDPLADVITWTGTLPRITGYIPGYAWGDSDGNGTVPGVTFDWIDVSGTGTNAGSGDDWYYCGLPIGFAFDYYGTSETSFCASTNGFVSFDTGGYSDLGNDCPLPSTSDNAALIAGIWDDLVVADGIYYQTLGTAPDRYLVVQWVGVRHFGDGTFFDFEIILHENGTVKVQMLDAGPETGSGSTTGIEDYTETQGLTYACDTAGSIHDNLAVLFLPIMVPLYSHSADISFAVTTAAPLPVNTWITNTAIITAPYGAVERSASTLINPVDLSRSTKTADKSQATIGEVVRYDFNLVHTGLLTAMVTLTDAIPLNTTYVPGSLTYTAGTAGYDPLADVITWTGTLPRIAGYIPGYAWGDSDGNGTVPGVTFDWIDVSGTGTNAGSGDDWYYCGLPIGFAFDYYGTSETSFCASTNGFVSFDTGGYSDLGNDCPLPSTSDNAALIAGIWDDLVVADGIYYQTLGTAPDRYLVVQWVGVRHFGDGTFFDFEIILHENGTVKVQMLDAGPETGSGSTTGIEDYTETQGLTYACDTAGSIHDNLAVLFLPITLPLYSDRANISFAVTLATTLPDRTPVINTAFLDNGHGDHYNLEAVFLARSSDLSASFKQAAPTQLEPGDIVTYTVYLRNAAAAVTTGEMQDELPPELAFVPGSLTCGTGHCDAASGVITWTGTLPPRGMVPVRFRATLSPGASPGELITNTAVVTDLAWMTSFPVEATVTVATAPDYRVELMPRTASKSSMAGETVTFTLRITNTGNLPDRFTLTASGNTWVTNVPSSVGPLAAGMGQNIQVTVNIPADASGSDTATVTATSQGDPSASASSVLRTTARRNELYLPLIFRSF